ncbi:hypothetical protein RHSIM_Rhsim08G0184000 [Rhododendron simsii]|uniref:AMP-dependent synthetase/ligase domain-containing protein n=1 Tax=Rhododendron simsii TaxID=118357 RepID=A0A834LGT3_RHOSS|nr:hypothetical protein RHSIM_Rhsim08G0184000 [Rhododendron simsii]
MASSTLTGLLKQVADQFPFHRAVSVSGQFDLTHARLQELIDQAASQLVASGVKPGDGVALTFPNTTEVPFSPPLFSCLSLPLKTHFSSLLDLFSIAYN